MHTKKKRRLKEKKGKNEPKRICVLVHFMKKRLLSWRTIKESGFRGETQNDRSRRRQGESTKKRGGVTIYAAAPFLQTEKQFLSKNYNAG